MIPWKWVPLTVSKFSWDCPWLGLHLVPHPLGSKVFFFSEMGNAGSVREEGGEGKKEEEMGGSQDLMGQTPPHNPTASSHVPLLFTPQRLHEPGNTRMQNLNESGGVLCEQGIPTMITWCYGGKEVAVEGSWDDWKTRKTLQKLGKDFTIMKVLPSGAYQYKFIVDGEWRYAPDLPWMHDEMGNTYNILDLQDTVPEDSESIAGFEPPQSPESSYNNWPLAAEDYAKEPPMVPPQLHLTLFNVHPNRDDPSSLSRPQHVVLNHLYIQKGKSGQPMVALGSTHRFMAKCITVILYKSLQR